MIYSGIYVGLMFREVGYPILIILLGSVLCCNLTSSNVDKKRELSDTLIVKEIQLTFGQKGHFLNQRQVFSPDDNYLVFDNRNEDSKIGENPSIQTVHVETKEIATIYKLADQQVYGPGVGAASFHPLKNEVVFIHGLMNASRFHSYGFTRRFAMQVSLEASNNPFPMEARDVEPPFTKGALRGGSHAYSYSSDGQLVSFTYNDAVLADESEINPAVQDLRTIGAFIEGKPVAVQGGTDAENFAGNRFAVLLADVTADPKPGSDEISKAYEECWVGEKGYSKPDGTQQLLALAFLADVNTSAGERITEVFIADIPDISSDMLESVTGGSRARLPSIPRGVSQRRLTYSQQYAFPGVQGPRQWLRSSPDGKAIYFYRKDQEGKVQIVAISPNGGEPQQITSNSFSADTSFGLSADGKYLAYGADEALYLTRTSDGKTWQLLDAPDINYSNLSNINWSNSGHMLAYNRKVDQGGQAFFQIFILNLSTFLTHTL